MMFRRAILIGSALALGVASAVAQTQTPVMTSGGTTNKVPLFTGSSAVGNSVITQSTNGNVGIGAIAPTAALDVSGSYPTFDIETSGDAPFLFEGSSYASGLSVGHNYIRNVGVATGQYNSAYFGFNYYGGAGSQNNFATIGMPGMDYILDVAGTGNVGINAPAPLQRLQVSGGSILVQTGNTNGGVFVTTYQTQGAGFSSGYRFGQDSVMFQKGMYYDHDTGRVSLINSPLYNVISERVTVIGNGNVGIGTIMPAALLEVNGNAQMDGNLTLTGSGTGIVFPNGGGTQTVAFTGVVCGGDYAESVDVSGDRNTYEPGEVLVIGSDSGADVAKSSEPYSTLVAGIYSTKPGIVGRRQTTDAKASKTEVPMAMVGIVPTKVSAENGPIKRGDLLVTASTPGYAMKGTDRNRMLGAVIGKALGPLDSGTGVVEVLVTLQ